MRVILTRCVSTHLSAISAHKSALSNFLSRPAGHHHYSGSTSQRFPLSSILAAHSSAPRPSSTHSDRPSATTSRTGSSLLNTTTVHAAFQGCATSDMAPSADDNSNASSGSGRMPVLFLSHGSPFSAFTENEDSAFWKELGAQLKQLSELRAIVMVSAHWEESPVKVNLTTSPPTIHDFYGFPAHFYKEKYPGKGAPDVAQRVIQVLSANGIETRGDTKHGLDHGSWVPLKWMMPLGEVPVVQLSLIAGGSMAQHVALGKALAPLRDEGILIVGSGTAVHNLRDMRIMSRDGTVAPYVDPFDQALTEAVCGDLTASEREKRLLALEHHPLLYSAHPSLEHLLPLHVAGGAALNDKGQKIFDRYELSFSNASFAFGTGLSF